MGDTVGTPKILFPPQLLKLGIMKQFVTALDKESAALKFLQNFSKLSVANVNAVVFVGPQIKKNIDCKKFPKKLTRTEKPAWNRFVVMALDFPGNHQAESCVELVETLVKNYSKMGCRMPLKAHILEAHLEGEHGCVLSGARRAIPSGYIGL